MVKKRKGRVLIDSDTEDSGSEENLDQVRGEARPARGAWDLRPAPGLGAAIPSPLPTRSPRGLRAPAALLSPMRVPAASVERARSPPAGPWPPPGQAARLGGFRGPGGCRRATLGGTMLRRGSALRRGGGERGPAAGGRYSSA